MGPLQRARCARRVGGAGRCSRPGQPMIHGVTCVLPTDGSRARYVRSVPEMRSLHAQLPLRRGELHVKHRHFDRMDPSSFRPIGWRASWSLTGAHLPRGRPGSDFHETPGSSRCALPDRRAVSLPRSRAFNRRLRKRGPRNELFRLSQDPAAAPLPESDRIARSSGGDQDHNDSLSQPAADRTFQTA